MTKAEDKRKMELREIRPKIDEIFTGMKKTGKVLRSFIEKNDKDEDYKVVFKIQDRTLFITVLIGNIEGTFKKDSNDLEFSYFSFYRLPVDEAPVYISDAINPKPKMKKVILEIPVDQEPISALSHMKLSKAKFFTKMGKNIKQAFTDFNVQLLGKHLSVNNSLAECGSRGVTFFITKENGSEDLVYNIVITISNKSMNLNIHGLFVADKPEGPYYLRIDGFDDQEEPKNQDKNIIAIVFRAPSQQEAERMMGMALKIINFDMIGHSEEVSKKTATAQTEAVLISEIIFNL